MAERASVVWMVNAVTGMAGRKGALSLKDGRLVFRPESGSFGDSVFALADVRRARRVRGTPVLELSVNKDGRPQLMGFYFVKPPSLEETAEYRPFQRRRVRKLALNALRGGNIVKKAEIEGWVLAIRQAQRS